VDGRRPEITNGSDEAMKNPDEYAQYFVVNTDLGMSPGKVAAQIGHAASVSAVHCMLACPAIGIPDASRASGLRMHAVSGPDSPFIHWMNTSFAKMTLGAPGDVLRELAEAGYLAIRDEGRTEIDPGSLTVVVLPPMQRRDAFPIVGHLKLYR
jgi:peptidyl-tRNA hydrolase